MNRARSNTAELAVLTNCLINIPVIHASHHMLVVKDRIAFIVPSITASHYDELVRSLCIKITLFIEPTIIDIGLNKSF